MNAKYFVSHLLVSLMLLASVSTIQAEECQFPEPINGEPLHNSTHLVVQPSLDIHLTQGIFGPCQWTGTYWEVVEDPDQFFDVEREMLNANSGAEIEKVKRKAKQRYVVREFTWGGDKKSITLPTLKPGKDYWWRAKLQYEMTEGQVAFGRSGFSNPTIFTTTFLKDGRCAALPRPYINTPWRNPSFTLPLTLKVGFITIGVSQPCEIHAVQWQIAKDANFRTGLINIPSPKKVPGYASEFQLTTGQLAPETRYWWRARGVSHKTGLGGKNIYSPWTTVVTFTTSSLMPMRVSVCGGLSSPDHVNPPQGSTRVSSTPIFSLSTPGLPPECSWDETAWQIMNADTGKFVFQSGFTRQNRYMLRVPVGTLKPSQSYYWRVKIVSRGTGPEERDVFSNWTEGSQFSTAP